MHENIYDFCQFRKTHWLFGDWPWLHSQQTTSTLSDVVPVRPGTTGTIPDGDISKETVSGKICSTMKTEYRFAITHNGLI